MSTIIARYCRPSLTSGVPSSICRRAIGRFTPHLVPRQDYLRSASFLNQLHSQPTHVRLPLSTQRHFTTNHATMEADQEKFLPFAKRFVDYVNSSPTPFHAVDTSKKLLVEAGFVQLNEKEEWKLSPNGKYFFIRNQSSIAAFALGGQFKPGNGFNLVGAHTDSPNLQLKPNFNLKNEGYHQVAIEPYGGGLWTTWFDRDLGIAGRVVVKTAADGYTSKLIKISKPILRIPTLAIHLDRESGNKLTFNNQEHLVPVLATSIKSQLDKEITSDETVLLRLLSKELQCKVEDIRDFELSLFDVQPSAIGGLFDEFIFSPRIDNLMMSFCSLTALIEATTNSQNLATEKHLIGALLFDHEEIGSNSVQGAASPIANELFRRVTGSPDLVERAIRSSFLISADMAHAVHPNYASKHDKNHKPEFHKGPVIKHNPNQRYASNAETSFVIRELAARNGIPVQDFNVRNDSPCGSTIGPILASGVGIRTVDIGNPQLSMHSIRETCATSDVTFAIQLLKAFYSQFTKLDESIIVE